MWTRPQIKDFKEKIRQDADSVITVGRGEVVTVRVPTHEEGSYLFWEFATDSYDIGFGVYFEWTDSPNTAVSVHVSESSDDEEEEEGRAIAPYSVAAGLWPGRRGRITPDSGGSLAGKVVRGRAAPGGDWCLNKVCLATGFLLSE